MHNKLEMVVILFILLSPFSGVCGFFYETDMWESGQMHKIRKRFCHFLKTWMTENITSAFIVKKNVLDVDVD